MIDIHLSLASYHNGEPRSTLFFADVVNRLGDRRDRAAGIDHPRPAIAHQFPAPALGQRDILPADFEHAMRGRRLAGGL